MASSPRFPLPFITHKNQSLFHDFLHFHLKTNLTSDSDASNSDDEAHTMDTLLTAAIHVASQPDNTTQLTTNETVSDGRLPDIPGESSEELSTSFKEPPVKKTVKKRATALKATAPRTRTRTRKNMDLDTKQAGDAKSDNEEGGEKETEEKNTEKDGEQAKRKREVDESDGEEGEKVEEEESADETDGSELGGFEDLKAKLAASSPAKKKQKKPQTESLTPPPSPKKVRGRGSKGSKGKDIGEDMEIDDGGEKSSEEPEDEKSDKEKEEKREEASNGKGGKGKKKKAVAKKLPAKAKRVPKAKKSTKEPADPDDNSADKKSGGEQKSTTAITKAEAGFIFDMCIADAKWTSICETSNKKFGRERSAKNLKKHCLTVMKDRAMSDYPDQ